MAIIKTSEELLTEITEDPNKFMEKVLEREVDLLFLREIFYSQVYKTKTSINSRMETTLEGETRKAEVKLIEHKPKE